MIRAVAIAAVAGLAAGLVAVPASAQEPRLCADEVSSAQRFGADVSDLSRGVLGFDGRHIRLGSDSSDWRLDDPADATFTSRFHSMVWLIPALDADVDVIELLVERDRAIPDPGGWASQDEQRATGWTQSVVSLRMGVVNCLYEITGDQRLVPVMEGLATAALDPLRYRGRPLNRIHNHGTMSNIALVQSAAVFDRPTWREAAVARFEADSSAVFSSCGLSVEQSSSYHYLNVKLWNRSLARVADEVPFPVDMGQAVQRAEVATWRLVRPDGVLEAIGDGNEQMVSAADLGLDDTIATSSDTRLLCSGRGWAANRGSWDDTATHYTLRFGERPRFHGHEDRGAPTWFTQGVPIFSDRGLYDKAKGQRRTWAQSAAAHSTFEPQGFRWPDRVKANLVSTVDATDAYVVTAKSRDVRMERRITIPLTVDDSGLSVLRMEDSGRSRYDQQWFQRWHLAPGWTPLPRTNGTDPAAIHEESGLLLYGACWSGVLGRGAVRTVEHFGSWRTASPAAVIECGTLGTKVRIDTLWVVSEMRGSLDWDRQTGQVRIVPDQLLLSSEREVAGAAAR
jgi:hypothetical protein